MKVTAELSSGESFTNEITPVEVDFWEVKSVGGLNISIRGTWEGTLTLQRKFHDEDDYYDVDEFTSNVEKRLDERELDVSYRLGFKSNDDYSSGTAKVRLSK